MTPNDRDPIRQIMLAMAERRLREVRARRPMRGGPGKLMRRVVVVLQNAREFLDSALVEPDDPDDIHGPWLSVGTLLFRLYHRKATWAEERHVHRAVASLARRGLARLTTGRIGARWWQDLQGHRVAIVELLGH